MSLQQRLLAFAQTVAADVLALKPAIGVVQGWVTDTPPTGFVFCNGQFMSISEYPALFNVIGTRFGGDGVATFALPNLSNAGDLTYIIRIEDGI